MKPDFHVQTYQDLPAKLDTEKAGLLTLEVRMGSKGHVVYGL